MPIFTIKNYKFFQKKLASLEKPCYNSPVVTFFSEDAGGCRLAGLFSRSDVQFQKPGDRVIVNIRVA